MLDLGFSNALLYSALRLSVVFTLRDGSSASGSGTGFVVENGGAGYFLATARHVVDPRLAIPKHVGAQLHEVGVSGWNHLAEEEEHWIEFVPVAAPIFPAAGDLDIAVIPLSPLATASTFTGALPLHWIRREMLASEGEFGADVRAGDFIASPGYASLPGVTSDRPVLLTGLIAADPRHPVTVERAAGDARAVLYQSLSRSGLSGAPVFATQRGLSLGGGLKGPPHRPLRLIGVNTGSFRDAQEQPLQFSYFTRSCDLLDLLDSCAPG